MTVSEDPNDYQIGPETVKTASGHVGEDTGAYGAHEVHKAGLGISLSSAFCVTEVSETGQCKGKVQVGDTLVGAQFSTLDQLGISTVAQFEEYMVGRGGYGGNTDTYLLFNCMPLLKAKKRDGGRPIIPPTPVHEPEPQFQMTCGCVLFTMLWVFLVIFCGYLAALESFKHIHKDDAAAEAPKLGEWATSGCIYNCENNPSENNRVFGQKITQSMCPTSSWGGATTNRPEGNSCTPGCEECDRGLTCMYSASYTMLQWDVGTCKTD